MSPRMSLVCFTVLAVGKENLLKRNCHQASSTHGSFSHRCHLCSLRLHHSATCGEYTPLRCTASRWPSISQTAWGSFHSAPATHPIGPDSLRRCHTPNQEECMLHCHTGTGWGRRMTECSPVHQYRLHSHLHHYRQNSGKHSDRWHR